MRPLLTFAAVLCVAAAAASLDAAAQQQTPPTAPAPSAAPATPTVVKAKKKHHRTAHVRHRHTRYASLHYRMYNPCAIVDGWRAFPTHARNDYFDTRPVCRRY